MINPHSDDLFEVASQWIVRLRSENATDGDRAAFSRWLNTSAEHLSAFDEALCLWEVMGTAGEKLSLDDNSVDEKPKKSGPYQTWGLAIAASLACLAVITMVLVLQPAATVHEVAYSTEVGEQLTVNLPDQSQVTLNTNTSIVVAYSERERVIRLLTGEAYFDVAPDKSRPFRVDLKRGSVTAVGTAFNILSGSKTDQVLVTEGVVRVKQAQDEFTPYPEAKFLRVHQALSLSSAGLSSVTKSSDHLPWLQQTLSFDNTPLEVAVNELNRYLPSPVLAEDPTLAKLRVSGTFSTEAPHETLAALLAGFDLTVQPDGQLALSTEKTDR